MRANAGDFIIGEAGRIDINSGQTLEVEIIQLKYFCCQAGIKVKYLQGVRYTAVESEVDYEKIKEILERYFGAR